MTFGPSTFGSQNWGADEASSRSIFNSYVDSGGNFVDTASVNASGRSEELLGTFIRETSSRERLVLATKISGPSEHANPNAIGNGRKHMLASIDRSLRRLQTDYVDLYWMHFWDTFTPVEEVMATFDALVRSGKVRSVGLSDVPAWYAAKAQMQATARGWEPVAALQLEYSLVERSIEREHIPAALDLGMSIIPWSPLKKVRVRTGVAASTVGMALVSTQAAAAQAAAPRAKTTRTPSAARPSTTFHTVVVIEGVGIALSPGCEASSASGVLRPAIPGPRRATVFSVGQSHGPPIHLGTGDNRGR